MDARTKGILATIASIILCGCPGLLLCVSGGLVAVGAPVNTEFNGVSNSTTVPAAYGVAMLCAAVVFILIPIAVAFFTLRRKPVPPAPVTNEPLPPVG